MSTRKTISGEPAQIWQQINSDFQSGEYNSGYSAAIQINGQTIDFDFVSSPGGGDEGGYSVTTFSAPLASAHTFSFAIHPEDVINKIGKLFGGQDVKIGYPEFDKSLIVKTNDPEKTKALFANPAIREIFQNMSGFEFGTVKHDGNANERLELTMQSLVNNVQLPVIFNAFTTVLLEMQK